MTEPPDRAYTSELRLQFGATDPDPEPPSVTDATDAALSRLRDEVVLPVARSILRDGETVSARLRLVDDDAPADIWLQMTVGDDVFALLLSSASWEGVERAGDDQLAQRLADALEDWVPETSFGWGEQRRADPRAHRRPGPRNDAAGPSRRTDPLR
ncbi:hypothetical protein [Blastococcus sp. SYSU DS0617]